MLGRRRGGLARETCLNPNIIQKIRNIVFVQSEQDIIKDPFCLLIVFCFYPLTLMIYICFFLKSLVPFILYCTLSTQHTPTNPLPLSRGEWLCNRHIFRLAWQWPGPCDQHPVTDTDSYWIRAPCLKIQHPRKKFSLWMFCFLCRDQDTYLHVFVWLIRTRINIYISNI